MSQTITQYTQSIQLLNCAYQRPKINDKSFDCVNINDKTLSELTEAKKIRNENDRNNNCERNASLNKKVGRKMRENETTKTIAKNKYAWQIKQEKNMTLT